MDQKSVMDNPTEMLKVELGGKANKEEERYRGMYSCERS